MRKHVYCIHVITPEQLPQIPEMDGSTRPPEYQDLLNLGLRPLGGDRYATVGAFPDGRGQYTSHDQIPGQCLGGGYLQERHDQLPPQERRRILRARVFRAAGHALGVTPDELRAHRQNREARGLSSRIQEIELSMDEVGDNDVVEASNVVPFCWAGEKRVRR